MLYSFLSHLLFFKEEVISFIFAGSFKHFINLFWFFVIFDLPRYLLIDFFALILMLLKPGKRDRELFMQKLMREQPLVSILIPGRNEGATIERCVRSLREQTYKNIEVVVVDDGSDDDMEKVCKRLVKEGYIDVFVRNSVRGGKASAANLAFRRSSGKYIIHMDADSSLDRDAVIKILSYFYDKKYGAVAGNVKVREPYVNLVTACQAIEYIKTISVGRLVTSHFGILRIVSGAFGAFRREVLEEVGGWDIGPGLDGDITVKIMKTKRRIVFAPDSVCLTNVPKSLTALMKQRLRWNRSLIRMRLRKHLDIPFPGNYFNMFLVLSWFDNIFFNMVLAFNWLFYHIYLMGHYFSKIGVILAANLVLYALSNYLQLLIGWLISERKSEEAGLFLYAPLMSIYVGYFIRPIRIIAYLEELFLKASYKDPWNPRKVSDIARRVGM